MNKIDLEKLKGEIVTNVYHITSDRKVPLHKHSNQDEVFYCFKGSGYGVLEDSEIELSIGKVFIVPAGILHSARTDNDLYVASFLIPAVD